MKKFLILYMMDHAGMEAWMKIDEATRKSEEEIMKKAWDEWTLTHKDIFIETGSAGQMTKVSKDSSESSHNDIMLFSLIKGESKESVTKLFETHPHLGIPDSWIEVMESNLLPKM